MINIETYQSCGHLKCSPHSISAPHHLPRPPRSPHNWRGQGKSQTPPRCCRATVLNFLLCELITLQTRCSKCCAKKLSWNPNMSRPSESDISLWFTCLGMFVYSVLSLAYWSARSYKAGPLTPVCTSKSYQNGWHLSKSRLWRPWHSEPEKTTYCFFWISTRSHSWNHHLRLQKLSVESCPSALAPCAVPSTKGVIGGCELTPTANPFGLECIRSSEIIL